ncbi:MAG: DUF1932 domain-containing protein [Pseudomonadota bacterium]
MSAVQRIGLLGFGEVGQMVCAQLLQRSVSLTAFDTQFCEPSSVPSIAVRGQNRIVECAMANAAVAECELVISAVTAEQCVAAAESCIAQMPTNAWYLDLNSVAPATKQRAADIITGAGGRYVEAAVMAPIHPLGLAAPTLLGGPHAEAFIGVAEPLGLTGVRVRSSEYGAASAAKMCRSVCIKGLEALVTESLLAAHHYGVTDDVVASLHGLMPGVDWAAHAQYLVSRSVQHGVRRAEEMREVAATLRAASVAPLMTEATVARQQWAGAQTDALLESSLAAMLDRLRAGQHPRTASRSDQ